MDTVEGNRCFVGIDVSKKTLDVCILPQRERFQVDNNGDYSALCERLQAVSVELIVLEGCRLPVVKRCRVASEPGTGG